MENSKQIHELHELIAKQQWDKITDKDWETLLTALSEKRDWEEMWRLAQTAPAGWSVRLLLRLKDAEWRPEQATERSAFTQLAQLAEECPQGKNEALWGRVHYHARLEGHSGGIACLAISPDGQILASGGGDHAVRLWRLSDGVELRKLVGHTATVTYLAFSPDGQLLASGDWETIRLWSLPDGTVLQTLERHADVVIWCVAFSPDGPILANGEFYVDNWFGTFSDKTVHLWRLSDGVELRELVGHTGAVTCLAFSPDGRMLASGSEDKTVRLWRLPDGIPLRTLEGHTNEVANVAFSPDGRMLASGTHDNTVRLWRLPDGIPLCTLEGHTGTTVTCLAFSPDGRVLASGSYYDKTVRLWSLPDGRTLQGLKGHTDEITCVAFSPDGQILASGSRDKTVRLWRPSDGVTLQILEGHTDGVTCLAFSPNGQMLVSGSRDGTVRLWKSPFGDVSILSVEQTRLEDLKFVKDRLAAGNISAIQQAWLKFILALMRRHLSLRAFNILKMVEQSVPAARCRTEEIDLLIYACQDADDTAIAVNACDYLVKLDHVEAIDILCARLQASGDIDPDIARHARQVLSQLRRIEAQEALCRFVIDHEFSLAREAALAGGYLPRDASQRALFLFLTEQWERYEAFDFDRTLLSTVCTTASPERRQRIADTLRKAGRTDFLTVLVGADYRSHMADMTPAEIDVLVHLLADKQEWTRLWTLVFELPLVRSLRIMTILSDQTWQPERDDERTLFRELRTLARNELVTSEEKIRQVLPLALQEARIRVKGRVNDVAFSPVRPVIAIGTGNRKVALWNFQQGEMEQVLKGFDHAIGVVTFLPDGTLLCAERTKTVTESCTIYAWHGDQRVRLGQHTGSVTALQAVGDTQFLSTGRDKKIILWGVATGCKLQEKRLFSWARATRVSPDGQYVAILDEGVGLMSIPQLIRLVDRSEGRISRCAAFVPHEHFLVVGRFNGEVLVYEYSALSIHQLLPPHRQRVQGVAVLPQSATIISVGAEGTMLFTTWSDWSSPGSIELPEEGFTSLHISLDGTFMATGHSDTSISFWDLRPLNIPPLFTHPFAHASLDQFMAVKALSANPKLDAPVRRALTYIKRVLQHRFRFAIEIAEIPRIKVGEFDIEIDA